jgi:hypothetical protein
LNFLFNKELNLKFNYDDYWFERRFIYYK